MPNRADNITKPNRPTISPATTPATTTPPRTKPVVTRPSTPTPDLPTDHTDTVGNGGSNTTTTPLNPGNPIDTIGGNNQPPAPVDTSRLVNGPHPVPKNWRIPADIAHLFGTPDEMLRFDVLKGHMQSHAAGSPFLNTSSDAFKSVLVLNTAKILEQAGAPLPTLLAKLDQNLPLDVSNVQVLLDDGTMGVRASTYGDDWKELIQIVKSDPLALFQKITMHREDGHKYGGPDKVTAGHAFEYTATHEGWFDIAQDENGQDVLVRGDYPTDYGAPPSGTSYYTFRMSAIRPEAMTFNTPVPPDRMKEAVGFVRTLGALSMGKVPFASGDADSWDRSYFVNDLEIDRGSKVQPFVDVLSAKLGAQVTGRDGNPQAARDWLKARSKYCAEGAHDRPAFLLNAKPTEGLYAMKEIFDAAVQSDQSGRNAEHPDNRVGWKALQDAGYIHNYDDLVDIGAAYLPFDVPKPGYKPLIEYGPSEAIKSDGSGDGLISQPVNIAGLAEAAIGTLLPRDKMASTMAQGFIAAFNDASPDDKQMLLAEAKGFVQQAVSKARQGASALGIPAEQFAPTPALGNALEVGQALGLVLASGIQSGTLKNDQLMKQIKDQARYALMDAPSKAKFDGLFQKVSGLVSSPTTNGKSLQALLESQREANRNDTTFTYKYPDGSSATDELIEYLPPQHFGIGASGFAVVNAQEYVADFFPSGYRP